MRFKNYGLTILFCCLFLQISTAQVGIGTTNPDPSSILDIKSTNQGVLFPRIDLGSLNTASPITAPATGLLVWNTDAANNNLNQGYYFWNMDRWVIVNNEEGSPKHWSSEGNAFSAGAFLGTTNLQPLLFKANNTAIGSLYLNGAIAFGPGAEATTERSIAIGRNTKSNVAEKAIAIGDEARSTAIGGVALGISTRAADTSAIALGAYSRSLGISSISLGNTAEAFNENAVAIGNSASSTAIDAIAIGSASRSSAERSIAIGKDAISNFPDGVAIGTGSRSLFSPAVAIGKDSSADGIGAVALGHNSRSETQGSTSIGSGANAIGYRATAIGFSAIAETDYSIVLGHSQPTLTTVKVGMGTSSPTEKLHVVGKVRIEDGNQAAGKILTTDADGVGSWQDPSLWKITGNSATPEDFIGTTNTQPFRIKVNNTPTGLLGVNGAIAFGPNAETTQFGGIAIGLNAKSNNVAANRSIAIGENTIASKGYAIALGAEASSSSRHSIALGFQTEASDGVNGGLGGSIAIGGQATALGQYAIALGKSATASGQRGMALGYDAEANYGAVSLGSESKAIGQNSMALGNKAVASAVYSTAIGFQAVADKPNTIILGNLTSPTSSIGSKIGIGTTDPLGKFHVSGNSIYITNNNEAEGRILTSNAVGKAEWADYQISTAYAELYKATSNTLSTTMPVFFNYIGVSTGIGAVEGSHKFKVTDIPGVYKVNYKLTVKNLNSSPGKQTIKFYLSKSRVTPAAISGSEVFLTIESGETITVSGEKMLKLALNEEVYVFSDTVTNSIAVQVEGTTFNIVLVDAD